MAVGVLLARFELGGADYSAGRGRIEARLDVSRTSGGHALRLRFPVEVEGPCMRCLGPAALELEIDAREVDHHDTEDEELLSPYVEEDELDLGRWAQDAIALALPAQLLCRPDCAGLCPVCGESLNGSDPATHAHRTGIDPRWDKLKELGAKPR
ncbi:MAG TPA: DUF177 domain-containing protein [Solirubrobacterales bacterium]|nr:DUF177 domain-containing protein [Solirubrobacterales bacterium]